MVPQLAIRTLGGLAVTLDGQPVTGFDSRKVAALLIYLAATGHDHPREILAEMLWEGRSQTQALANLRVALTSLRQNAGDFVLITREAAGMALDTGWALDTAIFEDALAAGRLSEALDLYQGDFLAGFYIDSPAFEDWAALERERLRFRAMDALDRLIAACLEHGDYADGIAHATRLLQMDPLREESHRAMMTLLASSGQRAAALAQFETCARTLRRELGITPAPETVALHNQIKAGELPGGSVDDGAANEIAIDLAPIPVRRVHLPPQATRFIGRETEIGSVIAQVRDPACRLLTLLGPGGIGKTRLALAAAERVMEDFPHGVCFVDLAPLHDPDEIPHAVATALGFQFYPGEEPPRQQLLNYLRDKTLLLILDNCEHLLDGVDLAATILAAAPGVTILATSREVLKLDWEWVFPVEGLPVNGAAESDAVRLFVDRARRRQTAFDPAPCAEAVQHICALVGGMPLGIELAAAWVGALPVEAIADEIGRSLDLLESDRRGGRDRHQSIRAVFDPTWARLSPAEQDAFMRLSVFRGGFTREAAVAVAGAAPRALLALLDCSLLRFEADSGRYTLHELLRQYATERLDAAGQAESTSDAHSRYYLDLVAGQEADLTGREMYRALAIIEADQENVETAWTHALARRLAPELHAAMRGAGAFYTYPTHWQEGVSFYQATIAALDTRRPEGKLGTVLGYALVCLADILNSGIVPLEGVETVRQPWRRGLAILRQLGDSNDLIDALSLPFSDSDEEDIRCCEEALALARHMGNPGGEAWSLIWLGLRLFYGRHDRAGGEQALRQGMAIMEQIGNPIGLAHCYYFLSLQLREQGRLEEALPLAELAIAHVQGISVSDGQNLLAYILAQLGRYDEAEACARQATAIARELGVAGRSVNHYDTLADIKHLRGEYAAARRIHEDCLRLAQTSEGLQYKNQNVFLNQHLGFDTWALGDYDASRAYFRQGLVGLQEDWQAEPDFLVGFAVGAALLSAVAGRLERAVELLAAAHDWLSRLELGDWAAAQLHDELKAELPADVFRAAWERGKAIPVKGLYAELLAELSDRADHHPGD